MKSTTRLFTHDATHKLHTAADNGHTRQVFLPALKKATEKLHTAADMRNTRQGSAGGPSTRLT